jgi:hypothetical protein
MVKPLHSLFWHQGPRFDYRADRKKVSVNVAGSSWLIHNMPRAQPVEDLLGEFKKTRPGENPAVLDFGAGSWLRYVSYMQEKGLTSDLHAVEFNEAFHGEAAALKSGLEPSVSFRAPGSFENQRRQKFDLILLVNVLNTMPEETHRQEVFTCLSERLNPLGWLAVYQRVWVESENPEGALLYGDGWLVPQPKYGYYTYRAKTGAIWFNARAKTCDLKSLAIKAQTKFTSGNTLFRLWEKPLE